MTKILFIIDSLEIGGAEKSLLDITHRFTKYEPIFLTLYQGNFLKASFEEKGIKVICLDQHKNVKEEYLLKKIQEFVVKINPLIVHATLLTSCFLSRKLKERVPSFVLVNSLVNNTYSFQRYKTLKPIRALKLFKTQLKDIRSASKVDCFFSNSETIKNTTSKAVFLKKNNITVIYRGRDSQLFNSNFDIDLRESLFPKKDKIFLNVGRLISQKGQHDLIKAFFIYLQGNYTNDILAIAGSGPEQENLKEMASSLGIAANVYFLGRRSDVPNLLSISDFFVFPSYYEGLPGSLIEAIFSRIPIIASNIPENLECVNKNTALIYKSGDVNHLAEQMKYARENPAELKIKVTRGYEFGLGEFQIQDISNRYEKEYDRLLGR